MKKTLLLVSGAILLAGLGFGCVFFYSSSHNSKNTADSLRSSQESLTQEVARLKEELDAAEKSTASHSNDQKVYIEELTKQLSDCIELQEEETDKVSASSRYEDDYPDLYAGAYDEESDETPEEKNAYLTFDDGPSSLTPDVLDLLDKYDAKATFFVVYKDDEEYTKYLSDIVERGHTLAVHSYSHDYDKIYASVDAFLSDFQKVYDWIYEETGQRPTLYRFPGGSTNGKKSVVNEIISEMERRGFVYYDWNVSSGDGSNLTDSESIVENITDNIGNFSQPVVLMHDGPGKHDTLRALPSVLKTLSKKGYSFHSLDEDMDPVQYKR